jgi:glycosyltransferase involved in cell wall biosynthesis
MLDELVSYKAPLISVIIPTFNSGKFIAHAVQSVLDQTYQRLEIIVIDDGSTDTTKDILREFNGHIRYCYQENRGPSAARNTGIKIARGDYICFLDADDIWMPNKLEVQLAFMKQYDDISLVFSDTEAVDLATGLHISILPQTEFRFDLISQIPLQDAFTKLLLANFIPTSMVMARKQCFAEAGLFDEGLRVTEDKDMWLRIAARFKIAYVPCILGKKRIHASNISRDMELTLRYRIEVWGNARRRFPSLAPAAIVNNLVANAYLQLGYILLAKDQRKAARQAGLTSLTQAARAVSMRLSLHKSLPSYRWFRGVGLMLLTCMGQPVTQSLWRAKNALFKRKMQL